MNTRIALSAELGAQARRELVKTLRSHDVEPDAVARQVKSGRHAPIGVGYRDMEKLEFVSMIHALRQFADEHPTRQLVLRAPGEDEPWLIGNIDDEQRAQERAELLHGELTIDDEVLITTI